MAAERSASELEYQRRYFTGRGRTVRIALGETPCVRRHLAQTLGPLHLRSGARVLELGCGIGRFTEPMLNLGYQVTALDLSEYLVGLLTRAIGASSRLHALVGRAEDVAELAPGPYDAVVGFFFLHHLPALEPAFDALSMVLVDGGQLAFAEPNGNSPLPYVQVSVTPGMSWRGEPSIPKMRPGVVFPMLRDRGFTDIRSARYGMLPPAIANTAFGGSLERALEAMPPLRPLSAYRVFHARRGRATAR